MKKRVLSLACCLVLVLSMMIGCGQGAQQPSSTPASSQSSQAPAASSSSEPAATTTSDGPEPIEFPLFDEVTEMSIFWRLNPKATASMKDYSEMRIMQEFERMANVRLVFEHAPSGKVLEKFNLMRVSGDYTDIVYWEQWLNATTVGGPVKALKDNFIIPINDLMAQYSPNYSKLMEDDTLRRAVTTDDGTMYGYALLRYNQSMKSVWGLMVRMDWLEKLGLEVPKTIDEYHDMLVAFRDQDPNGNGLKDEIPYTTFRDYWNAMFYPWGISVTGQDAFINVDNKAVFGPYTENYREAVTTLSQWYSEGLIDPEFASNDQRQFEARLVSSLSGALYGETGGSIGLANQAIVESGVADGRIVGIPVFTQDGSQGYNIAGDKLYNGVSTSISSTNPYPVETAKLFDWGYSEEGQRMWNFGIEGESYTMEGGKPVFTEMITNNPDGLSIDQALARYCLGSMQGPFIFMPEVRDQRMLFYDWQRESIDNWNKDSMERIFPPATLTEEESARYAEVMADISTYVEESMIKFINGSTPVSEFDNYLAQLKNMGIEEAIALKQASLDRFAQRG